MDAAPAAKDFSHPLFGRYFRSRADNTIASVWRVTPAEVELLELGGDDPNGALTWHDHPKQKAQTWTFKSEAKMRADWEEVRRGWVTVG